MENYKELLKNILVKNYLVENFDIIITHFSFNSEGVFIRYNIYNENWDSRSEIIYNSELNAHIFENLKLEK